MIRNLWLIWIMFFHVLLYKIFKVNIFIILLHLISSFSLTRYFLVPYAYLSIKSIDCIVLLTFALKAILWISSAKTLCLSFLNLCCVYNINLLFFMNSLWFFLMLFMSVWFFPDGLFYSQVALRVINSFYNF